MAVGVQGDPVTASSVDGVNVAVRWNDDDLSTRWAAFDGTYRKHGAWIWAAITFSRTPPSNNPLAVLPIPDPGQHQRCEYTTVVDKSGTRPWAYDGQRSAATGRYVRVMYGCRAGYASFYECLVFPAPELCVPRPSGHGQF